MLKCQRERNEDIDFYEWMVLLTVIFYKNDDQNNVFQDKVADFLKTCKATLYCVLGSSEVEVPLSQVPSITRFTQRDSLSVWL